MIKENLVNELKDVKDFFIRSSSSLSEEDSNFKPKDEMYSVANQVAHTAYSIDWFMDGMFNPKGFDMDFEGHIKKAMACNSLTAARKAFEQAIDNAIALINSKSDEELQQEMPERSLIEGPRLRVIGGIMDHTAHHRGALTAYARLLGKEPKMPYFDM